MGVGGEDGLDVVGEGVVRGMGKARKDIDLDEDVLA